MCCANSLTHDLMAQTTTTTRSRSQLGSPFEKNSKHFAIFRLYSDIVSHLFVRLPTTRTAIFNPCTRMLMYAYTTRCAFICAFLIYCNALTPRSLDVFRRLSVLCTRMFLGQFSPFLLFFDPCDCVELLFPVFCSLFHSYPLASALGPWTLLVCVLFPRSTSSSLTCPYFSLVRFASITTPSVCHFFLWTLAVTLCV